MPSPAAALVAECAIPGASASAGTGVTASFNARFDLGVDRGVTRPSRARPARHGHGSLLCVLFAIAALPMPGSAAPCPAGTVVRAAAPADNACVTPASRRRAAADNAQAPLLWVPGPFGIKTCASGFVWREAFESDTTCVTPEVRAATHEENTGPRGDVAP